MSIHQLSRADHCAPTPIRHTRPAATLILRGNNRTEIFCADADYPFHLEKLQQACATHGCDIHAYVLMANHVHLLITPHDEQGIAKAIQVLGRYYVQYYNDSY